MEEEEKGGISPLYDTFSCETIMMSGTIYFFLCSSRLVSFYRQWYGSFSYFSSRRRPRLLYVTSNTVGERDRKKSLLSHFFSFMFSFFFASLLPRFFHSSSGRIDEQRAYITTTTTTNNVFTGLLSTFLLPVLRCSFSSPLPTYGHSHGGRNFLRATKL